MVFWGSLFLVLALAQLPSWNQPFLDPLKFPFGGATLAENVSYYQLFFSTPELGTYNMAPMLDYHDGQFFASWKNSPRDEDQHGQRVMFSQSLTGDNWTKADGSNILFPNMSTTANPAALFAEPGLHINNRFYATASPKQFCLYPDFAFQRGLLARRVFPGLNKLGPVFWVSNTIPEGFEEATQLNKVLLLNETDSTTVADMLTLNDWNVLPCATNGTIKCEACRQGCTGPNNVINASNEQCHYTLPDGSGDVILYRVPTHGYGLVLGASVRLNGGNWSTPARLNITDDHANLNCGNLPDNRRYLLSNVMPNVFRDPLYLSTTHDGWRFNATVALTSCELPIFRSKEQPYGCQYRHQGGSKQGGCQYPQGMSVTDPRVKGFWAIFSLNKEDIWVVRAPFSSLL